MTLERARQIEAVWESIEVEEPDISTPMLMHRTAKLCKCSEDTVAQALLLLLEAPAVAPAAGGLDNPPKTS